MKVCYISGPYRANTTFRVQKNIRAAMELALNYWRLGYAVICPHGNSAYMDGELPDQAWLDGDLELVRRSDVIVMMRGWEESAGATAELEAAVTLGKEIVYE